MADQSAPSRLRYYGAHGGKSLLWAGQDTLALFVLIHFLRIDGLIAGTLFMVASFLNAGMDIVAGAFLSRSMAWRVQLVAGSILLCLSSFALLPWLPSGAAAAAAAVLIATRLSHSVLDVAHNALSTAVARVEGDFRMAQRRAIIASATSILVGLVAIPLRASDHDVTLPLLMTGVTFLALLGLAPLPRLMRGAELKEAQAPLAFGAMPRAILLLCVATLIGMIGLGAMIKCLLHVQFPAAWIGPAAIFVYMVARLAGVWLWQPLVVRLGNLSALRGAFALLALSAMILPVLASTVVGSVFAILLLGIAGGGSSMLCWAALMELLRFDAQEADMRQAWLYGAFTMSAKIGLGLSGLAVGAWIDSVSLPGSSLTSGSNLWSIALGAAICCLSGAALVTSPRAAAPPAH